MNKVDSLKERILKINYFSIFFVVIGFSILSFLSVYYVLNMSLKRDIEFTKKEYISSKKAMIKSQVDNIVTYIDYIVKNQKQKRLNLLKQDIEIVSNILRNIEENKLKNFLTIYAKVHPYYYVVFKDDKNIIFKNGNLPREVINSKETKNMHVYVDEDMYFYITRSLLRSGKKYYITLVLPKSFLHKYIQKKVLSFVDSLKFVFSNGYISIIQIYNFNGGKKFAKFVSYPKNPSWVGVYLNDDKKDAKGNEYRKEYLKILKTKKEGFFVYWFKKDGKLYEKISYVKLYKHFNWAIFGGIYIDEVHNIINKKKKAIKEELKQILMIYLFISFMFVMFVIFIARYENKLLEKIIDDYEEEINQKNKELEKVNKKLQFVNTKLDKLNKNLKKEVEEKTKELLKSYFTDKLTNLPNREKFIHDVKLKDCVAIINIDSFKEINDFYGVEVGDKVLKKVGEIISQFTEVYKLSADEYGVLGDDCKKLKNLIQEIVRRIEKSHIKIDDDVIDVSVSAGIGKSVEEADMALKYAKHNDIGKVIVYDENLDIVQEYKEYIKWKNIIKTAIKEKKIYPYVQPIVDAKTKEVKKYEVLMRLEHDGKIYPPFFLNHAKKAGLYVDLQKIMIEKAFEVFSKLDMEFSINLSVIELSNVTFKDFLMKKVDEYNVSDKLTIELLEDEKLMDEELLGFLIYLHEMMGIQIAIDDFGSGHSNISYLIQKLPVTILKIDGILIKDILKNKNNQKLIRVIIGMAKIFKLKTIAEFVENKEIADMLEKFGVDYLQGYYFSAPFDINELLKDKK